MLVLNTISRLLLSVFIFFLIIASSVTGSILKKIKLKLRIGPYEIGSFELKLMIGYDEDSPVGSLVFENFSSNANSYSMSLCKEFRI